MRLTKHLAAIAALSMTVAPTIASANPAASLSVGASPRAASATANNSELRGAGGGMIVGVLALAGLVVGIILLDRDERPDSP